MGDERDDEPATRPEMPPPPKPPGKRRARTKAEVTPKEGSGELPSWLLLTLGLAFATIVILIARSCDRDEAPPPTKATSASASSASTNPSRAAPRRAAPEPPAPTESEPVYPVEGVRPEPVAAKYCEAIHDLAAKKSATCCGADHPNFVPTELCTRTMSYAMQSKAIVVDAAKVDACAAAMEVLLEGCNWVGRAPPAPPEECRGIFHGALGEGAVCASSLECVDGLNCHELGAMNKGRCGKPRKEGEACGRGIDTLAAHTRHEMPHPLHLDCEGYCHRGECHARVELGGECRSRHYCGPGRTCVEGKCSDAKPPVLGEPCPGGECAGGARCIDGTCERLRSVGESCGNDRHCNGKCRRDLAADAGARGTCEMFCPTAVLPGPSPIPSGAAPSSAAPSSAASSSAAPSAGPPTVPAR